METLLQTLRYRDTFSKTHPVVEHTSQISNCTHTESIKYLLHRVFKITSTICNW